MSQKQYDLILYGATGFTGRLTAAYLKSAAGPTKWAIAGRSEKKLQELKAEFGLEVDVLSGVDSFDLAGINGMVQKTRAVISLVGPYEIYGSLLYKSCAEHGVHYFDLCGEVAFAVAMIQEHSAAAIKSGALMLNSCGFDSVPSDLCTYLAIKELKKAKPTARVGAVESLFKMKGGISGGTFASGLNALEKPSAERRSTLGNAFVMSPTGAQNKKYRHGGGTPFRKTLRSGAVGSFFIMAFYNTKIVYRSYGILEVLAKANPNQFSYGPDFHYSELQEYPNAFAGIMVTFILLAFAGLMTFKPLRALARKYGPQSGDGPTEDQRKNGFFRTTTNAYEVDGPAEARVVMYGQGDPGYTSTARMIAECCLSVLQNWDDLPEIGRQAGPLTPATALGEVLKERLERTGAFTFKITSNPSSSGQSTASSFSGKSKI